MFGSYGKVAKPETTQDVSGDIRPSRESSHCSSRALNQTIDDKRSFACSGRGSVMVRPWSWFYQALRLIDLFAGSDALSVNYVCLCQAPGIGHVRSSSVCQKHWRICWIFHHHLGFCVQSLRTAKRSADSDAVQQRFQCTSSSTTSLSCRSTSTQSTRIFDQQYWFPWRLTRTCRRLRSTRTCGRSSVGIRRLPAPLLLRQAYLDLVKPIH